MKSIRFLWHVGKSLVSFLLSELPWFVMYFAAGAAVMAVALDVPQEQMSSMAAIFQANKTTLLVVSFSFMGTRWLASKVFSAARQLAAGKQEVAMITPPVKMLWLDDNPLRTLAEKVKAGADYYQRKHGRKPTVCGVNRAVTTEGVMVPGIEVRNEEFTPEGHMWFYEEQKKGGKQ